MPEDPSGLHYNKLLEYKQVDIETERVLLAKAQNGCFESQDKLVLVNMKGIAAICSCYANKFTSKHELYGIGVCAFIETIPEFDPSKYDVRFITFARKKIHGAINESDDSSKSVFKLPVHIKQTIYHIESILKKINTTEYTKTELVEYIANQLGKTTKVIERVISEYMDLTNVAFLDELNIGDTQLDFIQTSTFLDRTPDDTRNPFNEIDAKIDLEKLLICLNDKEKEVVLRRWDILPYEPFNEISERWGVTRQAVSLKYIRAIKKLKEYAEELAKTEMFPSDEK